MMWLISLPVYAKAKEVMRNVDETGRSYGRRNGSTPQM